MKAEEYRVKDYHPWKPGLMGIGALLGLVGLILGAVYLVLPSPLPALPQVAGGATVIVVWSGGGSPPPQGIVTGVVDSPAECEAVLKSIRRETPDVSGGCISIRHKPGNVS